MPTAEGLEVDIHGAMSPAEVFLVAEALNEWVRGRVERVPDEEHGTVIREHIARKNWAITVANENLARAESDESR